MDEKEKINIIRQIQDSNIQLCISFSGAGFQFLNDILKLEGASKCLLNADIPYSKESLNQNFQKNPKSLQTHIAQVGNYVRCDFKIGFLIICLPFSYR